MKTFAVTFLSLTLGLCAFADAAVVSFIGTFNTKIAGLANNGVYGGPLAPSAIPAVLFNGGLTVTDGVGTITAGTWADSRFSGITVTGGTVVLTDGGVNDTMAVTVNIGGGAIGTLVFSVNALNAITGTTVNQANVDKFFFTGTTATLTDFANGGGQYTGSIQAVPEPGSAAVLSLVLGVCLWRRRR
jgi:hypothetical protein